MDQPPYSLIWSPVTFLIPKLKGTIKGTRFNIVEGIEKAVTKEFQDILEKSFQKCIEAWQRRMAKCIRARENTLKGTSYSFDFSFDIK